MDKRPQKLAIIRLAGFTPVVWNVISLPRKGKHECKRKSEDLSKFLTENANSAVVICGTAKAPKHQQGKILGLAYCSRQVVRSEPLIAEHLHKEHSRNGRFQYPWGLPIKRAVYFAAPYAETDEILGPELTKRIPRNKYLECEDQAIIAKILGLEVDLEINFSEFGLVSSPESSEPGGDLASPTFTYIFRFGNRDCWKIGYSKDLNRRQREFAQHVPDEVLGEQWGKKPFWTKEWSTKESAKVAERALLEAFRTSFNCKGERVQCTLQQLKTTRDYALKRLAP